MLTLFRVGTSWIRLHSVPRARAKTCCLKVKFRENIPIAEKNNVIIERIHGDYWLDFLKFTRLGCSCTGIVDGLQKDPVRNADDGFRGLFGHCVHG